MPTIETPYFTKSVACANDLLTVDSTTDIWPNQIGYLADSGSTTRRFQVTEIRSATVFRLKWFPRITDDNFARISTAGAVDAGYPGNSSSANVAAYDGGTATFPEQQVTTRPDYSKPSSTPGG